jgi:hypothetical protein
VVRYGGDEFAVVFAHQTPADGAAQLARRIVAAIEAPIALSGTFTITVGASIGLATASADTVVHQADTTLYQAKATKRHTPLPHHPRTPPQTKRVRRASIILTPSASPSTPPGASSRPPKPLHGDQHLRPGALRAQTGLDRPPHG